MSDQLALDLYQQDVSSFYADEICPEAETVYRFLLATGFKEAKAQQYLIKAFGKIAADVSPFSKSRESRGQEDVRSQVLAFVWEDVGTSGFKQSPPALEKQLSALSVAERATLVLVDGLGFSLTAVEDVLSAPRDQLIKALVAGRKAITPAQHHPSGSADNGNQLFAHLSEYLDGDMDDARSQKFEPVLQAEAPQLAESFAVAKGQLQLNLQKFYLDEQTRDQILGSGISDKKRRQFEAAQIDEAGSLETKGRWLRGLILVGLLLTFGLGAYTALAPKSASAFEPLTALTYEAVMMEEEGTGRLEFVSSSYEEVNEFLADSNSIGFEVPEVKPIPGGQWTLEGATVIDYETDKIATIQFSNEALGKMFVFYYRGALSDLPTATGAHEKDVYYQSYGNDQMNVIAYEPHAVKGSLSTSLSEGIVAMVVGRESAANLAAAAIQAK